MNNSAKQIHMLQRKLWNQLLNVPVYEGNYVKIVKYILAKLVVDYFSNIVIETLTSLNIELIP